jgi:hypothetical protein
LYGLLRVLRRLRMGTIFDTRHRIRYDFVREDGDWRVDNLRGNGWTSDLREMLECD